MAQNGEYSSVLGGYNNRTNGDYNAVVGGFSNETGTGSNYSIAGGGYENTAYGDYAVVSGGYTNNTGSYFGAKGNYAVVSGGRSNSATGDYAVISGGQGNRASGVLAAVPGGRSNSASGDYSLAAGRRAKAVHNGSFVWGDSTDANISSSAANQFIVRSSSGITMYTSSDLSSGASLPAGSGSWTTLSDRDAKVNITSLDYEDILARLAEVEVYEWSYAASPDVAHIGPMAQDLYAAFEYGDSDRYISNVDADGVSLAAIQALLARIETLEARIEALEACCCE